MAPEQWLIRRGKRGGLGATRSVCASVASVVLGRLLQSVQPHFPGRPDVAMITMRGARSSGPSVAPIEMAVGSEDLGIRSGSGWSLGRSDAGKFKASGIAPAGLAAAVAGAAAAAAVFVGGRFLISGSDVCGRQGKDVQQRGRTARQQAAPHVSEDLSNLATLPLPTNLYELLHIKHDANEQAVKKAYHNAQKICHPDVAGDEGEEMCMLLNDAYELLTDPPSRESYDAQIQIKPLAKFVQHIATDLLPAWTTDRKKTRKSRSAYDGVPMSKSKWDKVKVEDRGPKHAAQQFAFVDEWNCIGCRNCCEIAPHTFCIQAESGRANAYTQWGNSEEYLDYAIASCPVECIYWVSREELQVLEHVTADKMFDSAGWLPCPMAVSQGQLPPSADPFKMAATFKDKVAHEKHMQEIASHHQKSARADQFQTRLFEVFDHLTPKLRHAIQALGG
ncbi:unnamed protein product [Polarella glacialis]|nr:unnamed protein product [Polarella glacialis]